MASKFAVYGLNESLRLDLARRGVKGVHTTVRAQSSQSKYLFVWECINVDVQAVCPYYINTGMFDGVKVQFKEREERGRHTQ